MGAHPSKTALFLEKGRIVGLRESQSARIACLSGLLWTTQRGDPWTGSSPPGRR
ncbi:DUF2917 domain-containing protein [Pelomicrobium sp.]|jgi:hypothetical protein|uniref:DUF2917 domain-containing protein n=1 Tax=Pelomicrobium sp. TaxID=2815319 RepID=UPI003FA6AEF7